MLGKTVKKATLVTMLLFGLVSVTGCGSGNMSSYLEQQGVEAEKIVSSYKATVEDAKNLEGLLKEAIFNNNFSTKIEAYIGNNVDVGGLKSTLSNISNEIKDKCSDVLTSRTSDDDYIPSESEITEEINELLNSSDVYYFLDSDSGTVEQFFVIRYGNTIIKISINWLGGVIYDYHYSVL